MSQHSRRDFLKTAATAAAGSALLAGCAKSGTGDAPNLNLGKTYQWDMVTTWPSTFPVMGPGAEALARRIEVMSGGRLVIKVWGAGEKVPMAEVFNTVSAGQVQMGHGASYYWSGIVPAAQFFTAVPFGMTPQMVNSWMYAGGGQQLWEEVYAPFDMIGMPAGNTGTQMAGWFNREIKSVSDLQGLKMRIPGFGGKVMGMLDVQVQMSGGKEIYTNLELGVIDAAEWVGPYHDYQLGLHRIAKFYYYPGWQEPSAMLELSIHKPSFDALPADLQQIVRAAAALSNAEVQAQFESLNHEYLGKIRQERGDQVAIKPLPADVLTALQAKSAEALSEVTGSDPMAKKVYASYQAFHKNVAAWNAVGQDAATALYKG